MSKKRKKPPKLQFTKEEKREIKEKAQTEKLERKAENRGKDRQIRAKA